MRGQKKIVLFLLIVFLIAAACSKPVSPPPSPLPEPQPLPPKTVIALLTFHINKQLEERMSQINETRLKAEDFYKNYNPLIKKYYPEGIESLYKIWQETFKKADARMEIAKNLMNEAEKDLKENRNETIIASKLRKIMLHINSKDVIEACCGIRDQIDEIIKNPR